MPDAHRPYKVWGYPVVPIIFVLFAAAFLVFSLESDYEQYVRGLAVGSDPILNSVYGLVILVSGLPFYFLFRRSVKP